MGSIAIPGYPFTEIQFPNKGMYINLLINDVIAYGKGIRRLTNEYDLCLNDGYKIAFAVPNDLKDIHFYRQNQDGTWSHKKGKLPVTNTDSSGNIIYNPSLCDSSTNTYPHGYTVVAYFEIYDI